MIGNSILPAAASGVTLRREIDYYGKPPRTRPVWQAAALLGITCAVLMIVRMGWL